MRIKVKVAFTDAHTHLMHKAGEVIDFPEPRASKAIARGLAVAMEETPEKPLIAEAAVKAPKARKRATKKSEE